MRRTTLILLIAMLALAACDRGSEPELTVTTSSTSSVTTPEESPTTTSPETTTSSEDEEQTPTTIVSNPIEDYQIQVATTVDQGQVLWVTIPAESYTDRDLEDFVVGVVDDEGDIWEFHVLDDAAAVDAARLPEADRTEEEQALVDEHYLVSVTEGNVITFHGPFEAAGSFLIGS
jgi:ABC-type transport system substrate-binding protein